MNTEKEKQHYVPKFYLRNFSFENNKKQIGLFNTKTDFFISNGKLKTQAYKPFYYGHDGEIEDMLSKVEGDLSPTISNIISTKELPDTKSSEYLSLLLFTILTQLRNPAISNNIINNRKELIKRAKEIVPDDKFVETKIPEISIEETVRMALTGIKTGMLYCGDLSSKLLINYTDTSFITSDNPVVKYNQYLETRKWFGGWTGYGSVGLQIVVPLNQEIAVLFYDGWAYKVGDKRKDYIEVNKNDVNQLNILQLLNCESIVFFNENVTKNYIDNLQKKSKKFNKNHETESEIVNKIDEQGKISKTSKIVSIGTKNVGINLALSNCNITKKAKGHRFDNRVVQLRPWAMKLSNSNA